jgi:DNA repair exonuclease SbcCD ATPase subunit
MKEVNFKKLYIKNFLSVGETPIEINISPGLHIITGINKDKEDSRNGVGKSTITDALFFAIFGEPLRLVKKEDLTNWTNKKGCVVKIEFDVTENGTTTNYKLTRQLNPSKVNLKINDEEKTRSIGNTKETISKALGLESDIFSQSTVMNFESSEPFLAKSPMPRRKFIEDIFKLEIFGQMTKFMRKDYNDTKKIYDLENEKRNEILANINIHENQQKIQKDNKSKRLIDLNNRKIDIISRHKQIEDEIEKHENIKNIDKKQLLEQIKQLREKEKKIIEQNAEYNQTIQTNTKDINKREKDIIELTNLSEGVCAYCLQPFTESNILQKKNKIKEHNSIINELKKEQDSIRQKCISLGELKTKVEDAIDNINNQIKNADKQENQKTKLHTELSQNKIWLQQIINDIERTENEKDTYKEIIKELSKRADILKISIEKYKHKLDLIESCKFVVSDEGVKNIIVKKLLRLINGRLAYYLKRLDTVCTCKFDEYFDATMTNNKGRLCPYHSFSGGERKRIDLAMLFTFMDMGILQSKTATNIKLFDELLDTSIDRIGITKTLEILNERINDNLESIFIISHKDEAAKHATGEIIYLVKENDITTRKPYA